MIARRRIRRIAILGAATLVASLGGLISAVGPSAGALTSAAGASPPGTVAACPPAPRGDARCFALRITRRATASRFADGQPAGYGPVSFLSAYSLPYDGGSGRTVAVVDAYGDPDAQADLSMYRATYGLPACTSAGGCFRKLNQAGKAGPYPPNDPGWALETSLDLDMVSAVCPKCHIVLVESYSQALRSLGLAEDVAVKAGAVAVSNSYGAPEYYGLAQAGYYDHPGVAILASSGDESYGAPNFPAVLPDVIGVGGTSLYRAGNARGWTESAWSGASSGCSAYVAKPAWQTKTTCDMRSTSDISAVADPTPGVAVYDTDGLGPEGGWIQVGGTSVSSPLIAGMIGVAGNAKVVDPAYVYAHARDFHDITSGSNGVCDGNYLCTAVKGYDGPTGLGTPDGLAGL